MKRFFVIAAPALVVATAACGDVEQPEDVTNIAVPSPLAYQQELMGMTDMARNAVFLRAIRDAGRDCQEVTGSTYLGVQQDAPSWSATCRNESEWVILIGGDGIAQVVSATGAQAFGLEGPDPADPAAANAAAPANEATPAQ